MWSDALRDLKRYRFAWLSARRRAGDDYQHAMAALQEREDEVRRLKAALEHVRKSTSGDGTS